MKKKYVGALIKQETLKRFNKARARLSKKYDSHITRASLLRHAIEIVIRQWNQLELRND